MHGFRIVCRDSLNVNRKPNLPCYPVRSLRVEGSTEIQDFGELDHTDQWVHTGVKESASVS